LVLDSDVDTLPSGKTFLSGYDSFEDPYFRNQTSAHSERAMMCQLHGQRVASEKAGYGNPLANKKVTVRGTRPPCYNCHRAMHAFAQENGMSSIAYRFPADSTNSVVYSSGQNPAFAGPMTQKGVTLPNGRTSSLEQAYQLTYNAKEDKPGLREEGVRNVNRETSPGGYVYGKNAYPKATYEALNKEIGGPS
jgi:hypothetical protein